MSTLKICHGCERHVLAPEPRCPFCGQAFAFAPAPRRSTRMVMVGLWVVLGAAACGPGMGSEGTTAAASTGDVPELTTTTAVTSTGVATSMGTDSGGLTTGLDTIGDSSSDGFDDQGCSFYGGCPPDGGPVVQECDVFAQDCPAGEKCMPWANDGGGVWNATRCSPLADDPGQVGEPCTVEGSATTGIDDCDIGSMCYGVDETTNEGTCADMCTGSPEAPQCGDPGDLCVIANDGVIALCLRQCDPLLQDCLTGEGCYPVPDLQAFVCAPTWPPAASQGMECGSINDCDMGHVCVDAALFDACGGAGCCALVCDLAAAEPNAPCEAVAPGHVCQPYYLLPPPGYEDVGMCLPPA